MCLTPTWAAVQASLGNTGVMIGMYLGEVPCTIVAYLPDTYLIPVHRYFTGFM